MKNGKTRNMRKQIKVTTRVSESDKRLYIYRLKGEITIKVFVDASFCGLETGKSQIEYTAIIEDENEGKVPII